MKLSELIHHNVDEIQEMLGVPEPYSTFEDYSDYKILLLRRMDFLHERLEFRSEAFLLKEKEVFYFDRDKMDFWQLGGGYAELVGLLDKYYRNNQKIITAYSGQIEALEDDLFDRNITRTFMDLWFDLKKDLSKLENYYYRNGIVYHEFLRKSQSLFGELQDEFKDIEDGIQFQTSNINTLKSRLDGVHHYYDSIKSDRLNKTLLTLTVISGVFLPLNLIVGFFGMNTPGLFFSRDETGTEKVVLLLAGVFFVLFLGMPILHWIDRYLLRYVLGRYNFYKNIAKRIDELSERLRGK